MTTEMNKHYRIVDLLKLSLPSIAMMIFTSVYSIVDGFFISNFAGKEAFAAVNLVMPFIMILGSAGFMMGTGGQALISIARGRGDDALAKRWFSLFVYFSAAVGIICSIFGFLTMENIAWALGATDELIDDCVLYGRISMISLTAFILQYAFQALFQAAGKPKLGLIITVASGLTNIVLDFVLVGLLGWGVAGAAEATVCAELIGGITPIFYFARPNSSFLHLVKAKMDWMAIGKACANGSSEMVSNVAISVVSMVYNLQLMSYIGADGVAAYGTIMYVIMIFDAAFMGYAMGTAPLMSFQYGAQNHPEMRSLLGKSLGAITALALIMLASAELLAPQVAELYCGYDEGLMALTVHAFRLFSLSIMFTGFNIYGSSLFTSLGNGVVSAVISCVRTLILECGSCLLLPLLLGVDGIWLSVVVAEIFGTVMVFSLIAAFSKRYGFRD